MVCLNSLLLWFFKTIKFFNNKTKRIPLLVSGASFAPSNVCVAKRSKLPQAQIFRKQRILNIILAHAHAYTSITTNNIIYLFAFLRKKDKKKEEKTPLPPWKQGGTFRLFFDFDQGHARAYVKPLRITILALSDLENSLASSTSKFLQSYEKKNSSVKTKKRKQTDIIIIYNLFFSKGFS